MQTEFQDSVMTCTREDSSIEQVKQSKSLKRKRNTVNHHDDDDYTEANGDTDPAYSNRSQLRAQVKKVTVNGNSLAAKRNLRDRKASPCKSSGHSGHSNAKGQTSRSLSVSGQSPHRSSSRLLYKTEPSLVNSHVGRSSRQSSRLQNVDQNSSPTYKSSPSNRRSSRHASLGGQSQCR